MIRETSEEPTTIDPSTPCIFGIDVSSYQRTIDWSRVRSSEIEFACAKATEGTYYQDSCFAHNWMGLRAAGIVRGAYHFLRPNYDADAQAQYFLAFVNAHGGFQHGDFIMLDIESMDGQSPETIVNGAAEWVTTVKRQTGRTVLLYTGNWFWEGQLGDPVDATLAACPLWLAAYGDPPKAPRNWPHGWTLWQSSDGVQGWAPHTFGGLPACDIDRYYGGLASFRALVDGSSPRMPRWMSLGGQVDGGLTAVRNHDGRMEVLARGTDGDLWHTFQDAPGGSWSGWASLGGQITGRVAALRNADGRIAAFARGTDGQLWHIFQIARNGGWSDWESIGGMIHDLFACGQNRDGRLEIFARGMDGALWHIAQLEPGGGWGEWSSLGGQIEGALALVSNRDGRLEIFGRGTDSSIWHISQTAAGADWGGWASLGGSMGELLAIGQNDDGRLELFADGGDHALWHIWQWTPGSSWSNWASMGGFIDDAMDVGMNADGRLEVFARGGDDALYHQWQTAPGAGWSGWHPMEGRVADLLTVHANADGRLEVFVRGADNDLWHVWQTRDGGWSS